MPNSSLRTLVFALACLVAAGTAHAQSSSANSSIADAISAAERGQPVDAARFANDPLYGWLAYASLRRNIDTLPTDQAQSFLSRHEGQAVADTFRSVWLAALARRKDWPAFRAAWAPSIDARALPCADLAPPPAPGRTGRPRRQEPTDNWPP